MKRSTIIIMLLLAVGAVSIGGCRKKKLEVTFTNFTSRELEVDLRGPGEGTGMIGAMPGPGGRISTNLVIPYSDLPAHYAWTAGPNNGRFTIVKKSPDSMNIDVGTHN